MAPKFANLEHSSAVGAGSRMGFLGGVRGWLAPLLLLGAGIGACDAGQGAQADGFEGPPTAVVEIERLEPQLLRNVVKIPGQLAAQATVQLKTEVEAVLESIEFSEGAAVEAGQVLLRLRSDEQRARVQEAEAELALARAVYARTRRLLDRDVASTAELERVAAERDVAAARLERARVELARMTIRAPFPGIMGALHVAPGELLREQTELTRIDSVERLQLLFTLPESAVGLVHEGAAVQLRVAPYPGELFSGEIYFVSPSVEAQGRRFLVKAWIPNLDRRLRPGLFAQIEAEVERRDDALLVPESALVYGLEGTTVWRIDADDRAHAVPVELGIRQSNRVEIQSGLDPGDRIVTAGVHKVTAGGLVRGADASRESLARSGGPPGVESDDPALPKSSEGASMESGDAPVAEKTSAAGDDAS